MNQSQHDELARLFSQNMQVSQQPTGRHIHPSQQPLAVQPIAQPVEHLMDADSEKHHAEEAAAAAAAPIHFISSHYTGTAHVRPGGTDTTSEPSRSPPPPYHEALMPQAMRDVLRQHAIDPSALLPNQIHLFANADQEQRLRLLELWRIAPPPGYHPALEEEQQQQQHMLNGTWTSTTFEREEALARVRYEEQQQRQLYLQQQQQFLAEQQRAYQEEHMLDTHIPRNITPQQQQQQWQHGQEPISPIREAGEPAWPPAARLRVSSIAAANNSAPSRPETRYGEPEPYIVNGYAADRSAKSVDPVWAAAAGLWQAPTYTQAAAEQLQQQQQHQQQQQQQQSSLMADQYGLYEQVRNHADWERLNERIAREKLGRGDAAVGDDYEMEL